MILRNITFVLISGKMGMGKSTVAKYMKELAKEKDLFSPTVISIATPVKYAANAAGWNGLKDERGRKLLQDIGAAGRAYHPDTWIKSVTLSTLNESSVMPPQIIFVDDWRFPNEKEYLKSRYPVYTVRIETSDPKRYQVVRAQYGLGDVSENSLPNGSFVGESYYDFVIDNSGNLDNLRNEATKILNTIIEKEKYVSPELR